MDYKKEIIEMSKEIDDPEVLEGIYWFVRTIFTKLQKERI